MPPSIKIYKGKSFIKKTHHNGKHYKKVIILDLDETIGSFGDLYILWRGINRLFRLENPGIVFQRILDLYPEFLRYGILNILDFLYNKKLSGECSNIFLYTNNQCYESDNSKWLALITNYIHFKICSQESILLFDKIICAFKINNQIIEPLRTTHDKTYSDLIRCTLLSKRTDICFIDNTYYKKMVHDRVYYIQPKSYHHTLSNHDIIFRIISNWKLFELPENNENLFIDWYSNNSISRSQNKQNISIDLRVSQKIMYHLKDFFLISTKRNKTKKLSLRLGNFTRKLRN